MIIDVSCIDVSCIDEADYDHLNEESYSDYHAFHQSTQYHVIMVQTFRLKASEVGGRALSSVQNPVLLI